MYALNAFQVLKDDLEGAAVAGVHNQLPPGPDLVSVHENARDVVEGQTGALPVVEGQLVGIVLVEVGGNRAGNLEGNGIAHVVVCAVLPVASLSGAVVDVLDLFLGDDARGVLGGNGHVALHQQNIVGIGVEAQNGACVLDEVVTVAVHGQNGGGLRAARGAVCGSRQMLVHASGETAELFTPASVAGEDLRGLGCADTLGKVGERGSQLVQQGVSVNAAAPGNVREDVLRGIRPAEHLICGVFVGLGGVVVGYGDGVGSPGGVGRLRQRGGHGEYQGQGDQERDQFLHVDFSFFVLFLSAWRFILRF